MNLTKEQVLVQALINRPQYQNQMLKQDAQNAQLYLTRPDWIWYVVVKQLLKNGRDLNQSSINVINTDEIFDYKFVIGNFGKNNERVKQYFLAKFKQHSIRFAEIKSLSLARIYLFFTDYQHVVDYGNYVLQFNDNPNEMIPAIEVDFKEVGRDFIVKLLHEIKHPIFENYLIMNPKIKQIYGTLEINWYNSGLIPLFLLKSIVKDAGLSNWEFTRLMHHFSTYYLKKIK